ncbi:MAG: hypothetical protein GXY86_13300 [Firmicutes bacterium]|nr:hypothetical protein [Bacillota bacterium]
MKKLVAIMILDIIFILYTPYLSAKPANVYEKSFATPENAITYFIKALTKNDLNKAFKACAINDYSENHDFAAFSRRLDSVSYLHYLAPSEYSLYNELNKIECLARIGKQIKLFYYSILTDENDLLLTKAKPTDEQLETFIQAVDPKKITGLRLISIDKPSLVDDERYRRQALASAQCFGANDATERVALLKLQDNFYILGFHLYKFGSSWKIDSLCSPLANTPVYGGEKISFDEYIY